MYFDNSATALKPQAVIDAVVSYYTQFSTNPHANDAPIQSEVVQRIETCRAQVARFINADPQEVAFTAGATLSLNFAAYAFADELGSRDEVVLSEADHTSALLPFYELRRHRHIRLRFVPLKGERVLIEDYLALLSKRTRVVVITSASNTLGFLLDVEALIAKIKAFNPSILTIVDATQHLPHARVDVKAMQCDFLVGSAHKLLGPTGIGLLYIKKELQASATPYVTGGSMNYDVSTDDYTYVESIHKFEAGTPHAAGIYGFGAAVEYLSALGIDRVYEHDRTLKKYAVAKLSGIPGIHIYNPTTELGIVTFNYEGVNAQDLAFYLGKQGVVCRSGLSCSKLVRRELGVNFFVRVSFYVYNTEAEIDRLAEILTTYKKGDEIDAVF